MRRLPWILAAFLLLGLCWAWGQRAPLPVAPDAPAQTVRPHATAEAAVAGAIAEGEDAAGRSRYPAFLPPQAHPVLQQIQRGGPYKYRQDGTTFHNRERRLPAQPRGYYREYTVDTPGADDRGARRIVTGGGVPGQHPPLEYWYTDDHYRSFRRFQVQP